MSEKNLLPVVDNPRSPVLPWIRIPNLGSHILHLVRRRLPEDWARRNAMAPVPIETFVRNPPWSGAVHQASGWLRVGTTQGRGRYDRCRQHDKPGKDIRLRLPGKDRKRILNR